jgi:hypothetical protein
MGEVYLAEDKQLGGKSLLSSSLQKSLPIKVLDNVC